MQFSPDGNTVAATNLDAYRRNLEKIIRFIGSPVRLMAVVKANAYGHGMVECARTAFETGVSMLGVAYASEGVLLRQAHITAPVLVMGPDSFDNLGIMIDNDLTIALTSFEMLEVLKKTLASRAAACKVHIKVDTGMGRIGIQHDRAMELVEDAWNTYGITVEGIFSHFPSADEDKDPFSREQIKKFATLLETLSQRGKRPEIAHICNSAGTLKFSEAHFDLVRTGIMTYGLIPYPGSNEILEVEPVLSLQSRITFIKEVPAGFPVSYGNTFVTKRASRLATIPVGYAHGYKRHLSNKGKAIVNGVPVPTAGRVCMDQTVFDITDAGDARLGDPVILIGSQGNARITAEDHAEIGGTITHEIVTGITDRVSRTFIKTS
ncbi:MAG: alanine racemase [Candidatus Latescibacteria bacterium]|jgi:alanine racemase|nr:alanine racemase [Candidatus Latescibacterota bacterium]